MLPFFVLLSAGARGCPIYLIWLVAGRPAFLLSSVCFLPHHFYAAFFICCASAPLQPHSCIVSCLLAAEAPAPAW